MTPRGTSPSGKCGVAHCPCQDGDPCHYEDDAATNTKGMPVVDARGASLRLPCQVCGRKLTTSRDGLTKRHVAFPGEPCQGVGYQHARWPVGQRLRHYSGSVFEVLEDRGATSEWGDYLVACVWSQTGFDGKPMEQVGRERVFHGEYVHRHGWTPVEATP